MAIHEDSLTSVSLLLRVGQSPPDQAAWSEFVSRYGPKVLGWCRGHGLQPTDAEDVTQAVLLRLSRVMSRFRYDETGSFRSWLRALVRNAWADWVAERGRVAIGGEAGESILASIESREDLVSRLEETFDLEAMAEAVHRVRGRITDRTWDAFRLTAMERRPVPEVAAQLAMTIAGVYKSKSTVMGRIREELKLLESNVDHLNSA